jgi:hypothetical protein
MEFEKSIGSELENIDTQEIKEGSKSDVEQIKTEPRSLDYSKVEGDNNVPEYHRGIQLAIETYTVADSVFNNPKEQVIQGAVRLLSEYEVDPLFASLPESNLFALAISDTWLSTHSTTEKKSLLDILKLVTVGIKEDVKYGTYSHKVRVLSNHSLPRGIQFDPEATQINSSSEYVRMVIEYISENQDHDQTKEVSSILHDWSDDSKLSHVRGKLGIMRPDLERPFNIIVLNKSAQQMYESLGYSALCMIKDNEFTTVYNRDYSHFDTLEHEYAHSQSDGLHYGYQGLLFRGINEALTEASTSSPSVYLKQRQFLNIFLEQNPEYEELMYKAYVGSSEARSKLFSSFINDYGMIKFLTFSRVSPIDNPKMSGTIGESIYIQPDMAIDSFIQQQ